MKKELKKPYGWLFDDNRKRDFTMYKYETIGCKVISMFTKEQLEKVEKQAKQDLWDDLYLDYIDKPSDRLTYPEIKKKHGVDK